MTQTSVNLCDHPSPPLNCWRNRLAHRFCNGILKRLATHEYRAWVGGAIRYGLTAALRDEHRDDDDHDDLCEHNDGPHWDPTPWPCNCEARRSDPRYRPGGEEGDCRGLAN